MGATKNAPHASLGLLTGKGRPACSRSNVRGAYLGRLRSPVRILRLMEGTCDHRTRSTHLTFLVPFAQALAFSHRLPYTATMETTKSVPLPGDPDRRTLSELCEALDRSESTIYRYIDDGMPSYRVLGSRVFRWSEVVEWVESAGS